MHLLISLDEGVLCSRGRVGVERLQYDGGGEDGGDGREGRFFIRIDVGLGIRFSGVVHLLKFFGFDFDLSRARGSERWR